MCGIFALFNQYNNKNQQIDKKVYLNFMKGETRGPESHNLVYLDNINSYIGFHRLAINGFNDSKSEQPFHINNIYLICNGEIYNHQELCNVLKITPHSRSDCEIILHMYQKLGMEQTLQMIDGVFAFILIDQNTNYIYVCRDTYGIRPLFVNTFHPNISSAPSYVFSSELKCIEEFNSSDINEVKQFEPGHFSIFKINKTEESQVINYINTFVFSRPDSFCNISNSLTELNNITSPSLTWYNEYNKILKNIFTKLENAVIKRVANTEREIACLLSGGLDSSLICGLVNKHHKGKLHTWSIGFEGSDDLKYAQIVADHIGSIHHPITVSEKEFLDNIPNVIKAIESYDTTTVRASVGNWLICKYIKEQSNSKVIFNGDGSDEVMGGYLYFHAAPDCLSFDKECRKLLSNIHFFDVLRSDRSISSHGLEARTPFLDRQFVQYYLSIDPQLRHHKGMNKPEKYLIREAVNMCSPNLLPKEVLWRTKEAFSDGVSSQKNPWFETIQEYVKNDIFSHLKDYKEEEIIKNFNPYLFNPPQTLEQLYYRDLFKEHFKNVRSDKCIPYFWMPNFVNATDASARTLNIYKNLKE